MAPLDGKVIITTGGTQGVGEAVALHAAKCGARGVVFCGRQKEKRRNLASRIEQLRCVAEYVQAALSTYEDCRNVVHHCDERFGRVDGLVNAAADTNRGTLEETTVEFWDHQFSVNVRAPFILTQETVQIMKREQIAGSKSVSWTGIDQWGDLLPSGVYICLMKTNDLILSKKMILLR